MGNSFIPKMTVSLVPQKPNTVEVEFMGAKVEVCHEQVLLCHLLNECMDNLRSYSRPVILNVSDDDRKVLRKLCHPDKHGGSKQAEEMFKKIGEL